MPLQLLLLLVLLYPGRSLQLWEVREDEAKEAPGHLLARGRRQVGEDKDDYEDYGTDPPEVLGYSPGAETLSPKLQTVAGTSGQRDSAGPGTPEPATMKVTTGDSATGGAATEDLSTELATQGIPVTPGPLTKDLVTAIPPNTEAPSTEGAPSTELATMKALFVGSEVTETLTTQPAATEALSTKPAATKALTTQPTATEVLSMKSTSMEALSTEPAATEALTTEPTATEVLSMKSTSMEALSTGPADIEALSTEPTTTETPSKDPTTMEAISTQPATTRGLTTALVPADLYRGTTVASSKPPDTLVKEGESRQGLLPRSSVSPRPTEGLDYIPVKRCLLAIFVLALVATTFLVCTVVLAVRLSRKNHTYPVRSYSPTEMVCISALLPEREEGPVVTANGSLPTTKSPGLKAGPQKDRDGDDLTLHSFLP
ncbi:P-selectin glycoprotein ligand 1 isoform X1 [Molossus molossus]|uniref:Selectin P ligand n=1 Tax=Molossus molossus TaxID=27622 RepID=A0A7J8BZQ0_MOLMO|nr:P-selectin glycoprotein ligand 1 isoform X1 [Molossus molossus]XP_036132553.1 P-selectin glycoprotein ligand 1 isoform X1 [Molossus molossus]KAF6404061.1 selectin P ligand [Molossus molossus]